MSTFDQLREIYFLLLYSLLIRSCLEFLELILRFYYRTNWSTIASADSSTPGLFVKMSNQKYTDVLHAQL